MWRSLAGSAACTLLAALVLRRRFAVVTVTGDSMMPTLLPGADVLVRRARAGQLRTGQVVVLEMPGRDGTWATPLRRPVGSRQWVIKRVAAVPGDLKPHDCLPETTGPTGQHVPAGKLVVLGDNPAWSYDSRQIGYFPSERLLGVVVRQISSG